MWEALVTLRSIRTYDGILLCFEEFNTINCSMYRVTIKDRNLLFLFSRSDFKIRDIFLCNCIMIFRKHRQTIIKTYTYMAFNTRNDKDWRSKQFQYVRVVPLWYCLMHIFTIFTNNFVGPLSCPNSFVWYIRVQ